MKLLNENIDVTLTSANILRTVQRGHSLYRVHTIDEWWDYQGRWWTDAPSLTGIKRDYYRVTCSTSSRTLVTMEIYQQGAQWYIARVLD